MKTKKKYNPIPKDIGDYIAYSEELSTGLVWRVSKGIAKKGGEAGCINCGGYFIFKFEQKLYRNHRIVYFLNTGIDPEEKQVDHIDGNRLNNKISNLRLATHTQNQDNSKKQKNNISGVTGVHWSKGVNQWRSTISFKNKMIMLGGFCNKDKAIAVRIAAETDPRFRDQEYRNDHNDEHVPSPEMLEWAKQYLEDKIERLNWDI